MENRLTKFKKYDTKVSNMPIESWFAFMDHDRIIYDAPYQRDYVWTEKEQQDFLNSILNGVPLGAIAIRKKIVSNGRTHYEIVDGRQRLTTLNLFYTSVIPLKTEDGDLFFKDLNFSEQYSFGDKLLPMISLENISDIDAINYYLMVNFSGVPQNEEHKEKLLEMKK